MALDPQLLTSHIAALRTRLAPFDALELAFVYLDVAFQPRYLSTQAAKLLMVRNRNELELLLPLLDPIISFAKSANGKLRSAGTFSGLNRELLRPGGSAPSEELRLTTTDDRPLTVLGHCHAITAQQLFGGRAGDASAEPGPEETFGNGSVVVLHNLAPYQPLLRVVEQQRRARALIVLAFAELDTPSMTPTLDDLAKARMRRDAIRSDELDAPAGTRAPLDLLAFITRSVDIVDSLVASDHKITIEMPTSVLLDVPRVPAVRLLCHLLFEAVDFSGPFGKTRVKSVLRMKHGSAPDGVQIGIFAERRWEIPGDASPLERYLYRKSLPVEYRVAVTAESLSGEDLTATDELFAEMKPLEGASRNIRVVAEETLSENLRIAVQLAKEIRSEIRTALLTPNLLAFSIQLPLMLEKVPGTGVRP